jgi:hypothetical protein
MALLTTSGITLPIDIAGDIIKRVQRGSVLATLSPQVPQRFGKHQIMVFDTRPRAEFVGEGAAKSSDDPVFAPVTAKPHKAQVTSRFTNEVLLADEEYQLGVIDSLVDNAGLALSRALDLGAIHGINPSTGSLSTVIDSTVDRLQVDSFIPETLPYVPSRGIEAAAGLVVDAGYTPDGIAFDTRYAWAASTERYPDGREMHPELGLHVDISLYRGLKASVSDTVSGRPETTIEAINNRLAIVGDYQWFRWGIQDGIKVEMIEFGDPDGRGDLKNLNQIALRMEVIYGWVWAAHDAFCVIALD